MLASPFPSTPLRQLVQQLLLGHLEDLDARGTAAFVRGWSSALELVARTELTAPDATPQVQAAVANAVARIETARRQVLDDEP
ncbi:MAG: hypothetical protein AAF721_06280 [Myxococcota bacterium]